MVDPIDSFYYYPVSVKPHSSKVSATKDSRQDFERVKLFLAINPFSTLKEIEDETHLNKEEIESFVEKGRIYESRSLRGSEPVYALR